MKNRPLTLVLSIAVPLAFGFAGSLFTPEKGSEWYYQVLMKPSWNPPDWLFAPVWTVLFIMMGTALYLVVRDGLSRPGVKAAVAVYSLQLLLNLAWSALFFGMQSPFYAFLEIIVLWLAIVTTMVLFARQSRVAAYLLVPYLLWVSFASYLNFVIWQLNPLM